MFMWPDIVLDYQPDHFPDQNVIFLTFSCQHDQLFVIVDCINFSAPVGQAVNKMLMIQAFRPDRLLAATNQFVNVVLDPSFLQAAEQEMDLADIIENEVSLGFASFVLDFQFNFHFLFTRTISYNTKHLCSWLPIQGSVML